MDIAYVFLAVLIFLMYGITLWSSSQEGFENEGSITHEDAVEMYDDLYASIYDLLWNPQDMIKYEQVSMQDVSLADWNTKNVHVLDMACGAAPTANWFKELGVDYTGVDISDSMLKKARENKRKLSHTYNREGCERVGPPSLSLSGCLSLCTS